MKKLAYYDKLSKELQVTEASEIFFFKGAVYCYVKKEQQSKLDDELFLHYFPNVPKLYNNIALFTGECVTLLFPFQKIPSFVVSILEQVLKLYENKVITMDIETVNKIKQIVTSTTS